MKISEDYFKYLSITKVLVIFIFLLTNNSCSNFKDKEYSDNGISFRIPSGYMVSKKQIYKNGVSYVSVESKREKDNKVFIFTWVNDSVNLDGEILRYVNELKSEYEYNKLEESVFSGITTTDFGKYTSRQTTLFSSKDSLEGCQFWAIYSRNKTVIISATYEKIMSNDIIGDLEQIKSTFNIK